jgi:hypothetical protein
VSWDNFDHSQVGIKLFVTHQSISLPPLASFALVILSLVEDFSDLCSIQNLFCTTVTSLWLQEIKMMTSSIDVHNTGLRKLFDILIGKE